MFHCLLLSKTHPNSIQTSCTVFEASCDVPIDTRPEFSALSISKD